jgi:hypothetical protein
VSTIRCDERGNLFYSAIASSLRLRVDLKSDVLSYVRSCRRGGLSRISKPIPQKLKRLLIKSRKKGRREAKISKDRMKREERKGAESRERGGEEPRGEEPPYHTHAHP